MNAKQRDTYIDKSLFHTRQAQSHQPALRKKVKMTNQRTQHIKNLRKTIDFQSNPFLNSLKLHPTQQFLDHTTRVSCKCNRSVRFFCLQCLTPTPLLKFPQVILPLECVVLHHAQENHSKSSALPLCFLSDQVKSLDFKESNLEALKDQLQKFDQRDTYILYPHKDSIEVKDLAQMPKRVIVLDCTWYQTSSMIRNLDQCTQGRIKYVKLKDYETHYWRYQFHSDKALSSAEAIYFFYREVLERFSQEKYAGQFDNLLFLYVMNYRLIDTYHKNKNSSKAVQQPNHNHEEEEGQTKKDKNIESAAEDQQLDQKSQAKAGEFI